ncbi:aconitate hydratase/ribosomal protein subunit L49 [Schizosaccharomyces cryophilus OY26]|uniref:Aconitate hydratase, mitochondrial n=1 Tax=Schizosaccharomyces cryophilus (strain OY26 / ATCC MYA-4695 / CBS 11777 / NBRC 106824 / NRRL Y48691) TaxID=653667 RepID=S9W5F2_SCHCR|nr:aconitate hydratase/ribosomal protein subunit L49 [Schizosaccharomyces cryophilus OY26]EPY53804.1 aconitate hydratase/ribosomal protein subunit L49 [Schizosaccharomyces cryophilus OY26]
MAILGRLKHGASNLSMIRSAKDIACFGKKYADIRGYANHAAFVTPPYQKLIETLERVRKIFPNEKLTLAEKVLYAHLANPEESFAGVSPSQIRGSLYLKLKPDRVAMQDASAQMALLQFMTCGLERTLIPSSIHCDHLIVGHRGANSDIPESIANNKEIFNFLQSASRKYGIQFWGPGSGIIHQIVLENYAAPGGMMLGTDSHTPNAGGLGMIAIGVGGADAVDAMTNTPWELKAPKIIGVHLKGTMSGWTTPKDLILHLAGKLTVRGGTGHIIEYFGPGVESLSCTGMATICNMGAEVGATTSIFPYTESMKRYLEATHRADVANAAANIHQQHNYLAADAGAKYDEIVEINLSELSPSFNGPFTPDLNTPIEKFSKAIETNKWPKKVSAGLIGSCTNSSYQDMSTVVDVVEQATKAGLKPQVPFLVTPGSELIRATIERDGITKRLEDAGAVVLANACGPCIGMWKRDDKVSSEEPNAILTSFNRNFRSRNDGNPSTMNFLTSPVIVASKIFSSDLAFDPTRDVLQTSDGKPFKFTPPTGIELPPSGFTAGDTSYIPDPNPQPLPETEVTIDPKSTRLEALEPFDSYKGGEMNNLKVAIKVKGKCTTDHISAAGKWLKYKGHLSNICNNTLIGAVNAATGEVNRAYDNGQGMSIPELMWKWKNEGQPWLVVAEHNYGEGSAREHAALQPRAMNGRIILTKSFARIHETNLKKQGILPLTFANEADYEKINAEDKVSTRGITKLLNGALDEPIILVVTKKDGSSVEIPCKHTMSKDQVEFFKAGSALNLIRQKARTKVEDQKVLDSIKQQPDHYADVSVYNRHFIVTRGDQLGLPFRIKNVQVGDTIRFDKVSRLGSRDYTIVGKPYVDSSLHTIEATVLSFPKSALSVRVKHKRRHRHDRVMKHKQTYTILRINKLVIH